jgi:hypothetical protein
MEPTNGNQSVPEPKRALAQSLLDPTRDSSGRPENAGAHADADAEWSAAKRRGKKVAIAAFGALAAWFIISSVAQISCHALSQP